MSEEKKTPRKIIPKKYPAREQDPGERVTNFLEVSLGYTEDLAIKEAERCLQCKKPKCIEGCPVQVPIPEFIQAIKEGDFRRAIDRIKEVNILPAVCGRVCPQENQCEEVCLLGKKNEPVAIGRLERFAADREREAGATKLPETAKPTGKRVAIVGSGPSGLTCAFDLAKEGHSVKIFEVLHEPGGVLVYGIPEFRLPKEIVAHEINLLVEMGVEIEVNAVVGKLISIEEIMDEFDACYIATGAGFPKFMGIEGENLCGVYSANEFLTRANLMKAYSFPEYDTPIKVGESVVVVGGGNVAMDSVRTALRLGAKRATIVYRRSMVELPARQEEVHHAKEEGVIFELCANPARIVGDDGVVSAVECVRMDLCELDDSGRRRPKPIPGSEFLVPADVVIMAVGTGANPLVPQSAKDLSVNKWGYIVVDEETGLTSMEGVYAGGDIVTGSATVISAMGAGRKAARAINAYLSGKEVSTQEVS